MIALCVNSQSVNDGNVISLDTASMSIGARIEERLGAIGISQSELARRVGVRQSTMNSLIRGDNRTSRRILQIARELGTTPAYLTGETDDPQSDSPSPAMLGADERELFDHFNCLGAPDRKALLQIVRTMVGSVARDGGATSQPTALDDKQNSFKGDGS